LGDDRFFCVTLKLGKTGLTQTVPLRE